MVGIISVVIGGHFGGGDHFDGGDHFGGGTDVHTYTSQPTVCSSSFCFTSGCPFMIGLRRLEPNQSAGELEMSNNCTKRADQIKSQ